MRVLVRAAETLACRRRRHTLEAIVRARSPLALVLTLATSGCGRTGLDLTSPAPGASTTAPTTGTATGSATSSFTGYETSNEPGTATYTSSVDSACDPTSCTGCCAATGQCLAGKASSACGSGGKACAVCPSGMCNGGMCSSAMATLGNEVVLFGGNGGYSLTDTWTFDGTSWTQVSISSPPPARIAPSMATLP